MTPTEAEALLRAHGALLRGHFLLSSGRHADRYLQCAVALQYPEVAACLGEALAQRVRERLGGTPDAVVSPALGGLIIGHEVGRALGRRACFTERVDGVMALRRGFVLRPGERVLLVEDVVTTGLSSREALAAVRAAGAEPVAVACIAERSGLAGVEGLPLLCLLRLQAPSWSAEECPLCARGIAAVKPGSRHDAEARPPAQ